LIGLSPGINADWKNSIPSSAGVLGVWGVLGTTGLIDDELVEDFSAVGASLEIFGMVTEGLGLTFDLRLFAMLWEGRKRGDGDR
jgi:hypothetical protein